MHHHPIFFWHPKKKKFCQFYKFLFTSSSSALILIFLSSYTLTLVKCFNSHRMLDSTTNLSKAWQMVFWRIMPGTWCESDISILSDNSPSSFKKFSEIIHSPLYAKKEWENYSFFQSHGCSKCNFCMNLMPKKIFIFLFFYFFCILLVLSFLQCSPFPDTQAHSQWILPPSGKRSNCKVQKIHSSKK